MTDEPAPEIDAADAFERVRNELSLLHSAIEGLTAAREKMPDYSATLGNMAQALRSLDTRLQTIEQSRALSLSPVKLAEEINAAAGAARAQDQKMLAEARDALSQSLGWINGMINRGQSVARRSEREFMIGVGGFVAGILLWSIMPGAIVRSLPESWHAPEWMAARMMGVEGEVAGQCLIEAADRVDGQ
jgi:hypothetical protein